METDQKDAKDAIIKLEEARIILNRLLGPGGSFSEDEREKYTKNANGANLPEAQIGRETMGGGASLANVGATAPSNKALQGQNKFMNDNRSQRTKNFNQLGGGPGGPGAPSTLVDDANEDEFWYQTPKATDMGGNYQ